MVVGHHVISFGSRPDLDIAENMMPLCPQHHSEVHNMGTTRFVGKYGLRFYLIKKGFYFDEGKWRISETTKAKP